MFVFHSPIKMVWWKFIWGKFATKILVSLNKTYVHGTYNNLMN